MVPSRGCKDLVGEELCALLPFVIGRDFEDLDPRCTISVPSRINTACNQGSYGYCVLFFIPNCSCSVMPTCLVLISHFYGFSPLWWVLAWAICGNRAYMSSKWWVIKAWNADHVNFLPIWHTLWAILTDVLFLGAVTPGAFLLLWNWPVSLWPCVWAT